MANVEYLEMNDTPKGDVPASLRILQTWTWACGGILSSVSAERKYLDVTLHDLHYAVHPLSGRAQSLTSAGNR